MSGLASSPMSSLPDQQLDLRGTPCPINFVRTKLYLEKMAPGALLEVWLDPGEPIEQVPDSLSMEGYPIEGVEERDRYFALKVRRPHQHLHD
ncbi:sulfurtransferase TusA family protein [Moorena producens JHB]|uniref:Sulfurtransferase TusA family protein n=1 Tax=Moorena producens (strain JHB) TaxID=1454205 RepID=A0A1D9GBA2_MOOP1|nr:sulfurtransferase TusA family protein [Moorena producens]AOY84922.2 sulfurtransferase TusA family protein [Moorena producens JHB]